VASPLRPDAFSGFDPLLAAADTETSPWSEERYVPQLSLLQDLLSLPISAGDKQESGRVAKALDAWIAHELRRAGFPAGAVWPRTRRPRVLPEDLAPLEGELEALAQALNDAEAASERVKPPALRRAIRALEGKLPGAHEASILGDFYAKQIDLVVASRTRRAHQHQDDALLVSQEPQEPP
jgi:hypothetical protein